MFLALSLMVTSCYYDELPAEKTVPLPEVVSYTNDIQPLWDEDCINCHKPGATAPDLTAANSYVSLTEDNKYVIPGDATASKLHKYLIGDGVPIMPPTEKLTTSEKALVDKWINDGALNN